MMRQVLAISDMLILKNRLQIVKQDVVILYEHCRQIALAKCVVLFSSYAL